MQLDTTTEWTAVVDQSREAREIRSFRKLAFSKHSTTDREALIRKRSREAYLRAARILGYGIVVAVALIIIFA